MRLPTCVSPQGYFIFSIHKPSFESENLRLNEHICVLGEAQDGQPVYNHQNFPDGNVVETGADWIYEIPNPFPFRGTTYIGKNWADRNAKDLSRIGLAEKAEASLTQALVNWLDTLKQPVKDPSHQIDQLFARLPRSVLLAMAVTSTDPEDLIRLAHISCQFIFESDNKSPKGIRFKKKAGGALKPDISDEKLFEAVANNPCLPDSYKTVMVLTPGVQGNSEIVGEFVSEKDETHVFEYLRRNSYIPWGHYAANMAHDAIRYQDKDIILSDIYGMRHLYYQRTYVRLAQQLNISFSLSNQCASSKELETLRDKIITSLKKDSNGSKLKFDRSLWGWNFGFDFAPSGYRLHASHQQIHQQFAMIPALTPIESPDLKSGHDTMMPSYACGDLIADFIEAYKQKYGVPFFPTYEKAIRSNRRLDKANGKPNDLIVYEDEHIMLFVPKAQTSQWELQLMPQKAVGNILDADRFMRKALDHAIWVAVRTLGALGAKMVTMIEFSRKFNLSSSDQRLLYSFLPRLPESPGAFSEAQLRWINGHYPEDFAAACRSKIPVIIKK